MSAFDPDTFMQATIDSATSTVSEPIPVGEYPAVIDKFEIRQNETKKGNLITILDITWKITDAAVSEALGRDPLFCRQSVFLDVTTGGNLDTSRGKNVQLGKLRAALHQNVDGQTWSFANLTGAGPAMVKVSHRPDANDPETVYAEIKAIRALS